MVIPLFIIISCCYLQIIRRNHHVLLIFIISLQILTTHYILTLFLYKTLHEGADVTLENLTVGWRRFLFHK